MRFAAALEHIVPYEPGAPLELVMRRFGLTEVAKLASNEFPLPPFDEVKAAIVAALDELNRYPDGNATDLRAALADHYGRTPAEIVVGNGSCELLMLLGDALLEPGDEVVFADPSFVMYNDICVRHEARARALPSREFRHDLQAMAAAVGPRTKMVIVCNPNNPTGTYEPAAQIAQPGRAGAGRRARDRRRSLQRVRHRARQPGHARHPARASERMRPAHVLQDLRLVRPARRLRPVLAGADDGRGQGPPAVQRQPAGASGRAARRCGIRTRWRSAAR